MTTIRHAHQAPWAARALGLPYRDTVLRRIGAAPLDSTAWYLLTEDCPTDEIPGVVAAAEQLLPLDELLANPEPDIFFGSEYACGSSSSAKASNSRSALAVEAGALTRCSGGGRFPAAADVIGGLGGVFYAVTHRDYSLFQPS
ncbi:hypothetical protein AB0D46_24780 [Streptomyces sp. NPDC048383]|uniref:hypothetical protein n=1 Tax=Streptomyces sp. NPDC048383 TaxID=3155386 RepID=UPI00342D0DDF